MAGSNRFTLQLNDLCVDVALSGVARGDLFYRGASRWNNLALGSSTLGFLGLNAAGTEPAWNRLVAGSNVTITRSSDSFTFAAAAASPGGSNGQLQYRVDASTFGGMAGSAVASSGDLLTLTAQAATDVPVVLKGHASQSEPLQEWQASDGTVKAKVKVDGKFVSNQLTANVPAFCFEGDEDTGIGYRSDGMFSLVGNGGELLRVYNGVVQVITTNFLANAWIIVNPGGTEDTRIDRPAASVARLSNPGGGGASLELLEMTAPGTPSSTGARLYLIDNGGKSRLVMKWDDGSTTTLADQP